MDDVVENNDIFLFFEGIDEAHCHNGTMWRNFTSVGCTRLWLQGIVDYIVMKGASTLVETFGMLSPGSRHYTTADDILEWNSVLIQ